MLYMCVWYVVYRCVEIHCCYSNASMLCKVLVGGKHFIVVCIPPFEWGLQWDLCGVLKDKVFAHSPRNLAELRAAVETECHICRILCNRCLAYIAEGDWQFKHKI